MEQLKYDIAVYFLTKFLGVPFLRPYFRIRGGGARIWICAQFDSFLYLCFFLQSGVIRLLAVIRGIPASSARHLSPGKKHETHPNGNYRRYLWRMASCCFACSSPIRQLTLGDGGSGGGWCINNINPLPPQYTLLMTSI